MNEAARLSGALAATGVCAALTTIANAADVDGKKFMRSGRFET